MAELGYFFGRAMFVKNKLIEAGAEPGIKIWGDQVQQA
jgi:hypothetical protein